MTLGLDFFKHSDVFNMLDESKFGIRPQIANIIYLFYRRAWFNAMLKWEMVSPLRFYEIPSNSRRKADIEILFAKGAHGDARPFDGPRKLSIF